MLLPLMIFLLLFAMVGIGLGISWLIGLFNPIGYMGVPPWKVPAEARKR